MYNVMLVDDEEEARIAIEKKINWQELGFNVISTAENGRDALEKALECQPDVVMTDINMPFLNGLEFSKQLKEELPATKFVIFSGYDEFEYAKEAIELSAEEYILKPINSDELYQVFSRLKDSLDDEFDKRQNLQNLEKYYQESYPFFKEQFLIGLIEGHIEPDRINEVVADYGQQIKGNYYSVGIIKLSFDKSNFNNDKRRLLSVSLNQLSKERLGSFDNYYSLNYLGNVVVLGCFEKEEEYDRFVSELDSICKLSSKLLDIPTTAGVGMLVNNLEDLFSSFKSAKEATEYRFIYEENQAYSINDLEPKQDSFNLFENDNVNQILKQIKVGEPADLSEAIHRFFKDLSKKGIAIYQLKLSILEAYFEIIKLEKTYSLNDIDSSNLDKDIFNYLDTIESFEEIERLFSDKCFAVKDIIQKSRLDSTAKMVEKAKEYISDHFNESDLSVDRISSSLGVSPNYFSTVFKKNTGLTFVNYLTRLRMEKAVWMLENTDEKAYIIAGMVGIDEPNYFSYVFKKAYGVSPSKYRQKKEA